MIVFFGTSPRSAKFLELVIKNGLKISLVVSAPPKAIGKKQEFAQNPVVLVAEENRIPFVTSIKEVLTKNNLTVGLILDYNQMIPGNIIEQFPKGIINIHFSKLPRYRGPSPVQTTILNGDPEAWISYSLIEEKLDAGLTLSQTCMPLDFTETTEDLYQKLIIKAGNEIPAIIQDYLEGKLKPAKQTGNPTFTQKLVAENCRIDWQKTPPEIDRLIRAANPEPGAWCMVSLPAEKRLKILRAHLENGKLILDLVQLEGKNPVSFQQFRTGYPKAKM